MDVPKTEENMQKCTCMSCSSYNPCMKEKMQGLFCSTGKTDCDFERQGCVCGDCPVHSEYSLSGSFFCDN